MRRVRIEARAKLNLGLAVGPGRADGFHELATVFQSVTLADTLSVTRRANGFQLVLRHQRSAARGRVPPSARSSVPAGPDNLVLRAARLTAARFGLPGGARFTLTKRIPAQAGLGGGSADAAAAMVGLLALHGRRTTLAERVALGAEIGSDVPFALVGGTAVGFGRGERLHATRLRGPFRAVIAKPDWGVSTRDAFRRIDRSRKILTGWKRHLRFAESLVPGALSLSRAMRLGNTFEQVLEGRTSDLASLISRLRAAGLADPRMTGSGSAVFGIVPKRASIRKIVASFDGTEPLWVVRAAGRGLVLHRS